MKTDELAMLVRASLLEATDWRITGFEAIGAHNRPFSKHFTFRVQRKDGGPTMVFVKLVRGITSNRARLEQLVMRDHEITRFLSDAFKAYPDVAIPRPIACSREHLMLITEFVEGTRLQDKIVRNARFIPSSTAMDTLASDCRRCGQWLSIFQQTTRRFLSNSIPMEGDDLLGIDTITRMIVDRVEELHSEGLIDAHNYRQLIAYVEEQAALLAPGSIESSGVHGDFFPGNLLVRNDKVIGIDFVMFRSGSVYFDPTYFIYQLETLQSQLAYRSKTIDTLKRAFLEGYAPQNAGRDIWNWNPLCRIMLVMHATARMLKLMNATPTGLARRMLVRASLRSTKRQLLKRIRANGSPLPTDLAIPS